MPAVINTTPTKQLTSCDALAGAVFTTQVVGCDLNIINQSSLTGITNIEYEVSLGATVVDTINTTSSTYTWDAASLYYGETLSIKQTITSSSGTFSVTQSVGIPSSLSVCVFEYNSNMAGASTFDPTASISSGTVRWRMPNDTYLSGFSISTLGSTVGFDGTTHQIRVRPTAGLTAVQTFIGDNDNVIGFVDCTALTSATSINFRSNASLTSIDVTGLTSMSSLYLDNCGLSALNISTNTGLRILWAYQNASLASLTKINSGHTWDDFRLFNCNLSGAFTFTNVTISGGTRRFEVDNNSITSLNLTGSSGAVNTFTASSNNITGALDMTGFTFSTGATFSVRVNSGLTSIDHTGSSGSPRRYWVDSCNLTTSNITMFQPTGNADWYFNNNASLTAINLSTTLSGTFTGLRISSTAMGAFDLQGNAIATNADIRYQDCNFTAAETNENLVNLDAADPGAGASGSISMDGSNAAPNGTSGGFDGLTAKANLIAAGYTVTTN